MVINKNLHDVDHSEQKQKKKKLKQTNITQNNKMRKCVSESPESASPPKRLRLKQPSELLYIVSTTTPLKCKCMSSYTSVK